MFQWRSFFPVDVFYSEGVEMTFALSFLFQDVPLHCLIVTLSTEIQPFRDEILPQ